MRKFGGIMALLALVTDRTEDPGQQTLSSQSKEFTFLICILQACNQCV